MNPKLLSQISTAIRDTTHHSFEVRDVFPVGGGSISDAFRLEGTDNKRYFLKLNDVRHHTMFIAEASGLDTIAATNTLRVPRPIVHGIADDRSYLVLEYLELSSRGDSKLLGAQLAALHRCTSDNAYANLAFADKADGSHDLAIKQFGFTQDNFIGTTPQPNTWTNDWVTFWREQRLGFQLRLAAENGHNGRLQCVGEELLDDLPAYFEDYAPLPSLLHGDLWSGNHAFLENGTPIIFDPAIYYGDRECDLAMTELFGGYSADFYAAYRAAWPPDEGYQSRRNLYNLYHILNHANLFGGGYIRQAEQMMLKLLSEVN